VKTQRLYGLPLVMLLVSVMTYAAENKQADELNKDPLSKKLNPLQQEALKQQKRPKKKHVIYQWVDENGQTIISDVPHQGALEIKLPEPQTYNPPKIKPVAKNPQEDQQSVLLQSEIYNSTPPKLKITSPANDSWVGNNQGNVNILVNVVPALRSGQLLVIKLDQKEVSRGLASGVNLQGLDRGSHRLVVEVQMKKSNKVIASAESQFFVRRPTVNR